ncbi:MAG TPA: serine/threonine-protein kinase, partial [Gemmata sp.]|nr:serine/threonine-protein kinase [Gemmata sp.]
MPPAPPGYDFIRELVGGGMSIVYLAHELAADRTVAMKFLRGFASSSAVERFTVELRVLAALKHPNIVRVLAQDFLRADPFFTMEFEPGGTLAELVKRRGPLSSNEAATLIRAVSSAIQAAHAKGILHRDIKPSNVLLAADGTPKVSDFGLAKRTDKDDDITTASGAIGTPSYMPPEQISRKWGEITAASDVYSIGATLYHLLTGMPPFRGESNVETMRLVESEPPKRPRAIRPEIPLALEAIVMKCLEKKPADRYSSAEALIASLDRFLAGEDDPESPQLTRRRRVRRWVGRNQWALVGGMAMIVTLAIGGLIAMPRDIVADRQRDLKAGKPVVLLPAKGLPSWSERPIGGVEIATDIAADGACTMSAVGQGTVILLP